LEIIQSDRLFGDHLRINAKGIDFDQSAASRRVVSLRRFGFKALTRAAAARAAGIVFFLAKPGEPTLTSGSSHPPKG
jgi:hypothetical protein